MINDLPIRRTRFLGVGFDQLTAEEVLDLIFDQANKSDFEYVVTPNADHVVRLALRNDLLEVYDGAFLSTCDSRIVLALARLKGYPIGGLVTGSDLTRMLFVAGTLRKYRIAIVGGAPEEIEVLKERYQLSDVYHLNPSMGFISRPEEVEHCCQFVKDVQANIVFFAVGSPQQELLASKVKATVGARGVGLCIGASLLFLTGTEKRAPGLVSKVGLEWLYRLSQNPKRLWRRYLGNMKIFKLAMKAPRYQESKLNKRD